MREGHDGKYPMNAFDTETEELVAYLDGELSAEERRKVEARLASDARYRESLHALERSWEWLDLLPRSTASETFTRTTVEMVAVKTAEEIERKEAHETWIVLGRKALAVLAVATALWAGVVVVRWYQGRKDRAFLEHLPLVQRLELYRAADDLEFLRALSESGLFLSSSASDADLERPPRDSTQSEERSK